MIYLDSAATTLQKPPSVVRAACSAIRQAASPGRGGHRPAMLGAELAFQCRQEAAALFQVEEPEQVVFTSNATHALNIAIHSLVERGEPVLISGWEHNAVTRPLYTIGAEVRVAAGPLFDRDAALEAFRRQITPELKAVICNHVSNVFGFIQPVEEIAALCRSQGVPFILDASQSAGCLPVRMGELGAAFIAMPGHKGLYGPQGTGLLLCGAEAIPLIQGGTGSLSRRQDMPDFLPDRLEAGTHNIPGVAGLLEGIRYVRCRGTEHILAREQALLHHAVHCLEQIPGVRLYCTEQMEEQAGVLSFQIENMDCEEVGELLGAEGIAVRAGLHCAPLAHSSAGTLDAGTIRVSFSDFNTTQEIERLAEAVSQLKKQKK